jgi:hypothetical protein
VLALGVLLLLHQLVSGFAFALLLLKDFLRARLWTLTHCHFVGLDPTEAWSLKQLTFSFFDLNDNFSNFQIIQSKQSCAA